jgi:hypothetical protein
LDGDAHGAALPADIGHRTLGQVKPGGLR